MVAEVGHPFDADLAVREDDVLAGLSVYFAKELLAAHALLCHWATAAIDAAATDGVELPCALLIDEVDHKVIALGDAVRSIADLLRFAKQYTVVRAERAGAVLAETHRGLVAGA